MRDSIVECITGAYRGNTNRVGMEEYYFESC